MPQYGTWTPRAGAEPIHLALALFAIGRVLMGSDRGVSSAPGAAERI